MDSQEWTWRCTDRLHEHWPRVDRADLENLAEALQREDRWRLLEPSVAAIQWLAQGFPLEVLADH